MPNISIYFLTLDMELRIRFEDSAKQPSQQCVPSMVDLFYTSGIVIGSNLENNIRLQPAQSDKLNYDKSMNVITSGKGSRSSHPRYNPQATRGGSAWKNEHNGYEVPAPWNKTSLLNQDDNDFLHTMFYGKERKKTKKEEEEEEDLSEDEDEEEEEEDSDEE